MNNNIIIYNGKIEIKLDIEQNTVWLNQSQLAELFSVSVPAINQHIKNIFETRELHPSATIKKNLIVQQEGKRQVKREIEFYNLDLIISLGYRVNSQIAIAFRQWATKTLKEYMIKGFVLDDERLKGKNNKYLDELIERIREIRASEMNFYQKIRDIFKESVDYDSKAEETLNFFATIQNKLLYAITNKTAPEIIIERAKENENNFGLTAWSGKKVRKVDIYIAKNYLQEKEIKQLERFVVMFLDYLENYVEREQTPLYMKDFEIRANEFIIFNRYKLLDDKGKTSRLGANEMVEIKYEKFDKNRKIQEKQEADAEDLREIEKVIKKYGGKYGKVK